MSARPAQAGVFAGFPAGGPAFLAELARNNERAWFLANQARHDELLAAPAAAFVVALADAARRLAPDVVGEPRVGGSLFRIQRDLRFAPGAPPYKTHLAVRLRHRHTLRGARCEGPVLYMQFDAEQLLLGVGTRQFQTPERKGWVGWLAQGGQGGRRQTNPGLVEDALAAAGAGGHVVEGDLLARVPAGHAGHPAAELMRRKGLFICARSGLPKALGHPAFVDHCLAFFAPYARLFQALGHLPR